MKIDVKFSNDSTGYLYVWRDGVQIVNYHGPIGFGDTMYWKEGIYRDVDAGNQTIAIDYSNLKIVTPTETDVLKGVTFMIQQVQQVPIQQVPIQGTGTDAGTGTDTGTGTGDGRRHGPARAQADPTPARTLAPALVTAAARAPARAQAAADTGTGTSTGTGDAPGSGHRHDAAARTPAQRHRTRQWHGPGTPSHHPRTWCLEAVLEATT